MVTVAVEMKDISLLGALRRPGVRGSFLGLFLGQAASTSALTTSVSLGSILATQIAGTASVSGLPATINMVAASLSAFAAGMAMGRYGRRAGMLTGYLVGAVGAAIGCLFALSHNLPGFLVGSAMVGMAQAVVLQGRYAAADLVPAAARGRAVGVLLFGSVIGAALAALLTRPLQGVSALVGRPALELGWGQSAILLLLGAIAIGALFRQPGRAVMAAGERLRFRDYLAVAGRPAIRLGVVNLVVGQAVMVMLMNLFPIHALHYGQTLPTISTIISAHVAGMFALAWLSGGLVDKFGSTTISLAGGALLMVGALVSSESTGAVGLGVGLFLIGLGWNFCFVSGSALLAKNLDADIRARFQGTTDVLVWLCAGSATLGGGLIVGVYQYPAVGLLGGVAAAALLLLTGGTWVHLRGAARSEAAST
ncbi:MAG: MFS transporter [Candidatus Dormibacteraeota bacterium]|nr:MFS transporter [Candidatus Dormibacteraeota bacterium]